jgi:ribonuclease HI
VSKNSGQGALAAVARSSDRPFLGASVMVVQGISDPEVLEALACWKGLDLASDLLLTKVRVASDCLNVIKSLETGECRMGLIRPHCARNKGTSR